MARSPKRKQGPKPAPAIEGVRPHIVRIGPKGVITIPEENRRAMSLEPGKYLSVVQVGRSLVLSGEINDFMALTEQFQARLADAGVSPEGLLGELDSERRELFTELFGGPADGPQTHGA